MKHEVIIIPDWADPASIQYGKTDWEYINEYWIKTSRGPMLSGYILPLSYENDVLRVTKQRQQLKKAFDDSMSLVYQLQNQFQRQQNLAWFKRYLFPLSPNLNLIKSRGIQNKQ